MIHIKCLLLIMEKLWSMRIEKMYFSLKIRIMVEQEDLLEEL